MPPERVRRKTLGLRLFEAIRRGFGTGHRPGPVGESIAQSLARVIAVLLRRPRSERPFKARITAKRASRAIPTQMAIRPTAMTERPSIGPKPLKWRNFPRGRALLRKQNLFLFNICPVPAKLQSGKCNRPQAARRRDSRDSPIAAGRIWPSSRSAFGAEGRVPP